MSELIDTGNAPEVFCDDLGKIQVSLHTVCWSCVRYMEGNSIVILKVVTPISAVPNIAAQIATAFASILGQRVVASLRAIANMAMH